MQGNCEKCKSGSCCFTSKKSFKFGMAFGVANAIFMLALGWAGWLFGYGTATIEQTASLYYGFAPTLIGGLLGAVWGLVMGFVYGYIFGIVLHCCTACCCGKGGASCSMSKN